MRTKDAKARPNATSVHRRYSYDPSFTGLIYAAVMLFMLAAAVNTQANLLFGVLGLMIGVLLVSGLISRMVLRRLRIRRAIPEHLVVGKRATLSYEFTNAKHFWPSLSVSLGELDGCNAFTRQPHAYMLHAAAGMTAVVPIEVVPQRRGLHTMDRYQLSTGFPFGFVKRAVEAGLRDHVLVYPALAQVNQRLLSLCRSAEKSGTRMRPRRGGADEFYGVKEYRPGENPRLIHWRRSARTGVLVSREMTQVAPPRLLLLVDTQAQNPAAQAQADVERAIAMAASLASHALEEGLAVGLCAWSDTGWVLLPPNRGKRQRRDVLTALARLPVNTSHSAEQLLDAASAELASGTTPVLLTVRDVQMALGEQLRSGMVVLSSNSPEALHWFQFDPQIDFAACMPLPETPSSN